MYGWRGRIGLMLPYDNAVIEPEFARTVPNGVSAHVVRTTKTDRLELAEESLLLAPTMQHLRANIALYACNASSFIKGRAWHDAFLVDFQARAGVPSESANSALMKLAAHRKVRRLAVVTPYPEWLLDPLRKFVEDFGFEVAKIVGLGLEPPDINALGPEHSYRFAKQADVADADGIIIVATNFRTLEVLTLLEQELRKPVMSSNQALMWIAGQMLGVEAAGPAPSEPRFGWPVVSRQAEQTIRTEQSAVTMVSKISAGVVVTADAAMHVWQPGYVIVRDGRIAEAGPGAGPDGDFTETVSMPDSILMPGLVNAHAHSPSNLVKGSWAQLPLEIWRQYIRAAWREYSDEAIYVSAQLGIVEMIRTGCTSVMDHFYTGSPSPHMGALHAVAAMADAGMRGGLALTLSDQQYDQTIGIETNGLSQAAHEEIARISQLEGAESLDDFVAFAEAVRRHTDLVTPIVGPSAPHRCSEEQLVRCARTARELDTMVHMHVCETKGQFLQGSKLFGCTPVAHLDRIGVLDDRLSMAHCVWLTDDDIARVAAHGTMVIHNPASNGKLGSGRMRFDDMLSAGVRLGLATDGNGSNDTQSMFEAMRLAGILHNRNDRDYEEWPSPHAILRAATSGSARALGLGGRAGMIQAAQLADLVLMNLNSYPFVPLNDPVKQIVYCENGVSVTDVMVGGRWVLRHGKLTTIDEPALYARARRLRAEMDDRVQVQFRNTAELEPPLRSAYLRTAPWSNKDGSRAS